MLQLVLYILTYIYIKILASTHHPPKKIQNSKPPPNTGTSVQGIATEDLKSIVTKEGWCTDPE
jgi:hypothetical protein